jgi:hypothetical protein
MIYYLWDSKGKKREASNLWEAELFTEIDTLQRENAELRANQIAGRIKFCAGINRLNRENEELRANQIAGRCETCRSSNVGGFLCDAWDDERQKCSDTEPLGYCHKWEARENG